MFIAKQYNEKLEKEIIVMVADTKEELEEKIQFFAECTIEETDINYELYNGQYLTQEEIEILEKERKIKEIDEKISELEKESVNELLYGNSSNIQVYKDVITGLRETKESL